MLINPSSVSFDTIKNDLLTYTQSKPNSQVWQDKYTGGAGTTVMELLAGLATYLQFTIAAARRESYLFYATARASAIAAAQYLGYSVFRGRNAVLTLSIHPEVTTSIPKLSVVGNFGSYQLITTGAVNLVEDVDQNIEVVIGSLATETYTVPSTDIQVFRFTSSNISDDIRVLLSQSGEEAIDVNWYSILNPISYFVDSQYYWVLSNALGGVDIMYLNDPNSGYTQFAYIPGSVITVQFVELEDITFSVGSIPTTLDFDGTIIATVNTSGSTPIYTLAAYRAPETVDAVRVNAPISHESDHVIRGRTDYKKLLKSTIEDVTNLVCASTNGADNPLTPAIVNLTYVLDNETLLTAQQKTDVVNQLSYYRPFGEMPPVLFDPSPFLWDLDVTIYLDTTTLNYMTTVVRSDIEAILANYEKVLGVNADAALQRDIEQAIEQLSYIKVARVVFGSGLPAALDWNEYLKLRTLTITIG